ncbi:oxygen-independent coproporphyrinogen-3 oxidase [Aliiroseovarius halocynthiae]|uniref:Heme chaperone HemW n=1 Tax=Aliiroseovarius halocynthiae TaxID=985055 RepID=A0A545SNQ5_9RHOB|nr:radical SAM family heme chaperone HemW [Aliiroseovarius halocynthiae]TQV66591.1 coproporphyrinogen III oxidase [Aliiroseovarius halocynthiae]SMR82535.1 oxygen-independent coproporphyrinogen-3 oxidase [Aliiroseovarius halocynthiae]
MLENWQIGGFGLYVHWPFCAAKCPYCDFNSHVSASIDQDDWAAAYLKDLDRYGAETQGRTLSSIYFGGGTPSLMNPSTVAAIIDKASDLWTFANDIEITLEANPTSIEAQNFAGYRDAGVNRISMGFQALNDVDLRKLGRMHSVDEGLRALEIARTHFSRVSFDLIYARQDQSLPDWKVELDRALNFEPDHLSLYQLTIEPGTAFGARFDAGKLSGLPEEDLAVDMFFHTQEATAKAGLPAYEVSNHARPGEESRHNLIYWRSGDWIGVGPGAHGRLTFGRNRWGTETPLSPSKWLENALGDVDKRERAPLPSSEQVTEYLLMGLRTREGIDLVRLQEQFDSLLDASKINGLEEMGLISSTPEKLRATDEGRPVLNGILRELLPG